MGLPQGGALLPSLIQYSTSGTLYYYLLYIVATFVVTTFILLA